MGVGLIIYKKG